MKREFLKDLGLEADVIDKIMAEHGKTIEESKKKLADVEDLKSQIEEKDKTIKELSDQIKDGKADAKTIEELKAKVVDYEKAEDDRKRKELAAEHDRILTENITQAIGDVEFVNDITKDGIINQIKAELDKDANSGKSAKEIFEALTKDTEGILKNPQHDTLKIPPAGGAGDGGESLKTFPSFF